MKSEVINVLIASFFVKSSNKIYLGKTNKGVNKKSLQILVKVLDFFKNIIYNK